MLNNFSPNMLKTYAACPRKYFYKYTEGVNVPLSSTPFEKGKKIHALANYFLQGVNISRIETALTPSEKEIWQLLQNNPFYKKDCLKSEFQLSCRLNTGKTGGKTFWIGGRLDAVVHDYDEYYILDYKTGSVPQNPEYDYQTIIYLLCMDKYLINYDSLSFVYINLRDKQNYVIEFNRNLKQIYEEKITGICRQITDDSNYYPTRTACKNCEYFKICSGN